MSTVHRPTPIPGSLPAPPLDETTGDAPGDTAPAETDDGLAVGTPELAVLLPEVVALADRMPPGPMRERYGSLRAELAAGHVAASGIELLERLLELGLQTGRFRGEYGPEAALRLNRLYHRTPRGRAAADAVQGVDAALNELVGQRLEGLALRVATPGSYELTIETGRCQILVALGLQGARVVSVEAGL